MEEKLEERLNELKAEFEAGQKMLAELEAQRAELQQTVLRISGAIQVLEELMQVEETPVIEAPVVAESTPVPVNGHA